MEEQVGLLWHRLITGAAADAHPQAAVTLEPVRATAGVLFRALGGDAALRVENATAIEHGARRRWLQRIAGSQRTVELAWRDEETLRLPGVIAAYPLARLNRDLYLWLAALAAAQDGPDDDADAGFIINQRRTQRTLARWPGLLPRYRRLVAAELARRPSPARLPALEAATERALRAALEHPGTVDRLPAARRPPQPVLLWLQPPPCPAARANAASEQERNEPPVQATTRAAAKKRRRGERVDEPGERSGLLAFRLQSLFSWTEYVNVDRTGDDDDDDSAERRTAVCSR